jgi:hypothetical protein
VLSVHAFPIFVGKRLLESDFKDDSPMTYEEKREVVFWNVVVILDALNFKSILSS